MASEKEGPIPSQYIQRCSDILNDLQGIIPPNVSNETIVDRERVELDRLRERIKNPPKLTVAVYGDMGSGKSSLLNAILDQPSLVPTAGMGRACTSVVIKIEASKETNDYDAEIEFLTEEEWKKELTALSQDMMSGDDDDSDVPTYETARAKIAAVYGDADDDELKNKIQTETDVTEKLRDKYLRFSRSDAMSLQDAISQYVTTTDEDYQFWPLVKQVTLRVPNSKLCSGGASLIDLPGVGDSNPARDDVAKKYIKDCEILMIVTLISRATDNKTAKDVMGERMHQQVQLDNKKTVIVCTQTDNIKPNEIIRKLKLPEESKWREESQKLRNELKEYEEKLQELDNQENLSQELLREKNKTHENIILVNSKQKELQREKSSRCAVARNKYVKKIIQKRDASSSQGASSGRSEHIFCVSSCDYIKLSEIPSDDDDNKPPVFKSVDQTEIPDLRNFLKSSVKEKRDRHNKALMADFKGIVSGLTMYLTNNEHGGQRQFQEALGVNLRTLREKIEGVISNADGYIDQVFEEKLYGVLDDAVIAARDHADQTCKNWARPVNKRQRERGGMAFNTYKATVQRDGVFTSRVIQVRIDMNADLTDPFLRMLNVSWREVFSEQSWEEIISQQIQTPLKEVIEEHTKENLEAVQSLGLDVSALSTNIEQLCADTLEKLHRLESLPKEVQRRQCEITRQITDDVKQALKPTYQRCREYQGPGCFQEMKTQMALKIAELKETMFHNIKERVIDSLFQLKTNVIQKVREILRTIYEDYKKQLEPLWQTHGGNAFTNRVQEYKKKLAALTADIDQLDQAAQAEGSSKRKCDDKSEDTSKA